MRITECVDPSATPQCRGAVRVFSSGRSPPGVRWGRRRKCMALICLRHWQMNLEETLLWPDLLFSPERLSDNSRAPQAGKKGKDGENTWDLTTDGGKMTEMEENWIFPAWIYWCHCCVLWSGSKWERKWGRPEARPPSKWSSFMHLNASI